MANTFKTIVKICIVAVLAASVTGCATEQPKQAMRFFWPQLPERPRIEWLGSYSSQSDFPKEGFAKFVSDVAGDEEPMVFKKPIDIRSDGNGVVYVSDSSIPGLIVYDLKNRTVRPFGKASGYLSFEMPASIALDNSGNIYVSDVEKKGILVFSKDEKPLRFINTTQNVQRNGGIVFDNARNRLLVTDARGHKVVAFSPEGQYLSSFGSRGAGDGEFNFPVAVTINHKGEIVVGDAMNARIQIFDGEGKFLRKFGNRGDGPADLQILKDVAVDSEDNIYVSEGKGHKVVIFSTNGDYLLTLGGLYSALTTGKKAPGGFVIPQGLDIDKNDTIYVVDQLNLRFQVFQYLSDAYLRSNPIPGVSVK